MQPKIILSFVIFSIIISLTGSITFLLTTPPQSYILFFLFFLLTTAITLTILGKTFILKIQLTGSGIEHVFLILATITLVMLRLANIYVETINSILYVIVFIFASGFSLLNILKFKPSFSRVEFVALAYPLSLALLAIVGTIALILPSNLRGTSLLLTITFLSIISLFVTRKEKQTKVNNNHELIVKNNELILLVTLLIFVYFFTELYPELASLPGLDISRNFLQALAFTKDTLGDSYNPSALYPLFSIYQSSIIYIAKPSVEIFQTTTVFLNLFAILSFYAMASQYLKRYGDHTPAIATLIWATFAGFGWLNFLTQKIGNPDASLLSLIGQTNAFSYGDITWRRLFFYLSMEASLTLVFAVLYLLKRNDLSKAKQILLMTLLMSPLPLMHPYGIYFLFSVLLCFAVISSGELKQQLRYAAYSLTIASFASLLLNYILNLMAPAIPIAFLTFSQCLLIGLALITITSLQDKAPRKLTAIVKKILDVKYIGLLVLIFLLILYFASLLLWFSGSLTFDFTSLNRFGYVPLSLYPVKLGVAGILAIVAIYIFSRDSRYCSRELGALLASLLLMIFVSRLLSTMQMQYVSEFTFNPNSWFSENIRKNILSFREERMFELFKVPLAIIASLLFGKMVQKTKSKNHKLFSQLTLAALISLILITCISSTLLGFQYYQIIKTNSPSLLELETITTLRNSIYENGKAIIISPKTPSSYLGFTGATAIVTESAAAWSSKWPELPMFITRYTTSTPTYIYIHKTRDYEQLSNYAGNYLEHILSIAPIYIENSEVEVKTMHNWSPIASKSTTALVLPYDDRTMNIYKPFCIEEYKSNIVLRLFFEESMHFMNVYPEPINYNNVEEVNATAVFNGSNSYIRINGTSINFDKLLIELEFQPVNLTRNQVLISKFDWGHPPQKSFEIAQYHDKLAFKLSPDGDTEIVLTTNSILAPNRWYTARFEYDGTYMKIFIDDKIVASKQYQEGIFKSDIDIIIGAELYNNKPTAYANIILKRIVLMNDIPNIGEPIFYAYDILSSANLNYTTIISNDRQVTNYKTLVLPYDDIKTLDIIAQIKNDNNDATQNLIILNTNGYGPLLNMFGNVSSEYFTANGIMTHEYMQIAPLQVPIIYTNGHVDVKASYTNNSIFSPFIMTAKYENYNLTYVNAYPLISQNKINEENISKCLANTLNDFVKTYNASSISSWFTEPSLLFKAFRANGAIEVFSNSVASIKLKENNLVNIHTETSHNILTNITSINLEGCNTIQINSTEITVQKGCGFYTTLTAYNPYITLQSSQTTYINAGNNKIAGQTFTIQINSNVTILVRQPEISVNGEIQFENFYMLHPPTIYTDGRNTTLSGNITLYIYASDEATIALPYQFNSPISVKYAKPLMEFNEIASLLLMTPYILILILTTTILLIKLAYRRISSLIMA